MDINVLIIPFLSYIWFKYFRLRYIARNKSLSLLLRNILKYRCSQVALRIIIIFYGSISLSLSHHREISNEWGEAQSQWQIHFALYFQRRTLSHVEDVSYYSIYALPTMHRILISLSRLYPPRSTSFFQFEARQTASLSAPPSPRGASSANETPVSYRRLVPPAFAIENLAGITLATY